MTARVAAVVGAGGYLGRATAERLATDGFTVVGIDRDEYQLKNLPTGIRYEAGDPADPAAASDLINRIGPVDVLVNTIGTFHPGGLMEATPEDFHTMIDVNAGVALWLTQAVVPSMRDRGAGSIVHVAARQGLEPTAGMLTYGLSKAALVHLIRVLDLELRPLGIRVNAVAPQLIDTPKTRPYVPADLLAHAATPAGIAGTIAYLVSDSAALISGAVVPVYGS